MGLSEKGAYMNKDNFIEPAEYIEMYAVSCIHCGKATFKFSKNMFSEHGYGFSEIKLKCPICGRTTLFMDRGTEGFIETG